MPMLRSAECRACAMKTYDAVRLGRSAVPGRGKLKPQHRIAGPTSLFRPPPSRRISKTDLEGFHGDHNVENFSGATAGSELSALFRRGFSNQSMLNKWPERSGRGLRKSPGAPASHWSCSRQAAGRYWRACAFPSADSTGAAFLGSLPRLIFRPEPSWPPQAIPRARIRRKAWVASVRNRHQNVVPTTIPANAPFLVGGAARRIRVGTRHATFRL
jgi:hypothetical protein